MLKKTLLTTIVLACLPIFIFSKEIIYVKQGAQGTGASWSAATGDLQYALSIATAGSEIWIAEGEYFPVNCNQCANPDRTKSFIIPAGVKLYGGFSGNEKRLSQRDWKIRPTKLSGNIGQADARDNSFTVITLNASVEGNLIDGLIISDGMANAEAYAGHSSNSGGAVYFDSKKMETQGKVEFKNCLFLNNAAIEGGAVFMNRAGANSLSFYECAFTNNIAKQNGGAVYAGFEEEPIDPIVNYCQFVNNEAPFGAGIFTACSETDLYPQYLNSTFANNKAQKGSSMYFTGLIDCPQLRTNRFINNLAENGNNIVAAGKPVLSTELLANATTATNKE